MLIVFHTTYNSQYVYNYHTTNITMMSSILILISFILGFLFGRHYRVARINSMPDDPDFVEDTFNTAKNAIKTITRTRDTDKARIISPHAKRLNSLKDLEEDIV